jgi:hypothetical protein
VPQAQGARRPTYGLGDRQRDADPHLSTVADRLGTKRGVAVRVAEGTDLTLDLLRQMHAANPDLAVPTPPRFEEVVLSSN